MIYVGLKAAAGLEGLGRGATTHAAVAAAVSDLLRRAARIGLKRSSTLYAVWYQGAQQLHDPFSLQFSGRSLEQHPHAAVEVWLSLPSRAKAAAGHVKAGHEGEARALTEALLQVRTQLKQLR